MSEEQKKIIANLQGNVTSRPPAEPGSFYIVANDLESYADMVKTAHSGEYYGRGGNDHFASSIRSIRALWNDYQNGHIGLEQAISRIESTNCIMSWFSMILSIVLFGSSAQTQFGAVNIPITPARAYLGIWKSKLTSLNLDENDVEDIVSNGMNVYLFDKNSSDYRSLAGCCSKTFFVIPPREVIVRRDENSEWKNFYFQLMNNPDEMVDTLVSGVTFLQKIQLLLSARSMPDDHPIKIIKDIILNYVTVDKIDTFYSAEIPWRSVGAFKLYNIDNTDSEIYDNLFNEKVYLIYKEGKTQALYPFSRQLCDALEEKRCFISNIEMQVTESENLVTHKRVVRSVSFDVHFSFFIDFSFHGDDGTETLCVKYAFPRTFEYQEKNICYLYNLSTFCMFPDIPLEYENNCKQYTYYANVKSVLNSAAWLYDSAETLDLSRDGVECFDDVFGSFCTLSARDGSFYVAEAEKPCHILKAIRANGSYLGCVMNLKTTSGECPALLPTDVKTAIDLRIQETEKKQEMYAYIDYGSDTSAFSLRLNDGKPYTGVNIIRKLTAAHDADSYRRFMNIDESEVDWYHLPSYVLSVGASPDSTDDMTPYRRLWTPFVNRYTEFEKTKSYVFDNRKLSLKTGGDAHAAEILYNICFTIVSHAVANGCTSLHLLPSVPDDRFTEELKSVLDLVMDQLKEHFYLKNSWDTVVTRTDDPQAGEKRFIKNDRTGELLPLNDGKPLDVYNLMEAVNSFYLMQNVSMSAPRIGGGTNNLFVCVSIGRSMTTMTGIYTDLYNKRFLCAASSLEFGGSELLEQNIRTVLSHIKESVLTPREMRACAMQFLLGKDNDHHGAYFIPTADASRAQMIAKALSVKFFPNSTRLGKPRNASWRRNLSELMTISRLNTAADDSGAFIKARADLIMRYALLMPVVGDFIEAAVKRCGSEAPPTVKLYFCGGAASGILAADQMTAGDDSFFTCVQNYFRNRFTIEDVAVESDDSKQKQLEALASLNVVKHSNVEVELSLQTNITRKKLDNVRSADAVPHFEGDAGKAFESYCGSVLENFIKDEKLRKLFEGSFAGTLEDHTRQEIESMLGDSEGQMATSRPAADICPEMVNSTALMLAAYHIMSEHFGRSFAGEIPTDDSIAAYAYES